MYVLIRAMRCGHTDAQKVPNCRNASLLKSVTLLFICIEASDLTGVMRVHYHTAAD